MNGNGCARRIFRRFFLSVLILIFIGVDVDKLRPHLGIEDHLELWE